MSALASKYQGDLWCFLCKAWGDHVAAHCPAPNRDEKLGEARTESAEFWERIRADYRTET